MEADEVAFELFSLSCPLCVELACSLIFQLNVPLFEASFDLRGSFVFYLVCGRHNQWQWQEKEEA